MKSIVMIIALLFASLALAETPLPKGIIKQDGREAPALKLVDLNGNAFDLKTKRGNWIFVHFWAAWCS